MKLTKLRCKRFCLTGNGNAGWLVASPGVDDALRRETEYRRLKKKNILDAFSSGARHGLAFRTAEEEKKDRKGNSMGTSDDYAKQREKEELVFC